MKIKHPQLAHALALARHGNFRQAAEDQHLSQPAFSRSIHNLERSVHTETYDAPSELIHDHEYPVALQVNGFTPEQVNAPKAVLRVSQEGQP